MNIRNLEQIQETDAPRSGASIGTLLLSAVACGALVVAGFATFERRNTPTVTVADPLQQLLSEASQRAATPPAMVAREQVTFPGLLSDGKTPTTALAAVRDESGRLLSAAAASAATPPPQAGVAGIGAAVAGEVLRKSPLPAGDLLSATAITQAPKDDLGQLTKRQGELDANNGMAPPGEQGGYEIQVASFQDGADADEFVAELRKRGHRAYQQAAYVPDRGLWHRVRIGPFKSLIETRRYQESFEKQERVSTFLIDPDKIKRQEEIRDAKLKAREQRDARRAKRAQKSAEN